MQARQRKHDLCHFAFQGLIYQETLYDFHMNLIRKPVTYESRMSNGHVLWKTQKKMGGEGGREEENEEKSLKNHS